MEKFLSDNYTLIYHTIIAVAAIIGVFVHSKFKSYPSRYFIYFLIYVYVMAIVGSYPYFFWKYNIFHGLHELIQDTRIKRNYWWFTIFWKILSVGFFAWYFMKSLENKKHANLLRYVLILFIVSSILNIILDFDKLFIVFYSFIDINGGVVILFCVALYFMEILQSEKVLNFYKELNFYIALGILVFWLITTPLVFFEKYYKDFDMPYVHLRMYIYLFINLFMYGMFSVGLLLSKPKEKDILLDANQNQILLNNQI